MKLFGKQYIIYPNFNLIQVWGYIGSKIMLGHFFPLLLMKPFLGGPGPGPVSTVEIEDRSSKGHPSFCRWQQDHPEMLRSSPKVNSYLGAVVGLALEAPAFQPCALLPACCTTSSRVGGAGTTPLQTMTELLGGAGAEFPWLVISHPQQLAARAFMLFA